MPVGSCCGGAGLVGGSGEGLVLGGAEELVGAGEGLAGGACELECAEIASEISRGVAGGVAVAAPPELVSEPVGELV